MAAGCRKGLEMSEQVRDLSPYLNAEEVADVLRTTRVAVYAMVARNRLPGVTRLGRRVLFSRQALLGWLDQKRAPSPKEQ